MRDVAVDACCLINFHAGGVLNEIAGSASRSDAAPDYRLHAPPQVLKESLSVFRPDHGHDGKGTQEVIDLKSYLDAGVLHACVLGVEETALFVDFAVRLDDGEAACLAVAKSRGWLLATDDRKAGRIASENGIAVITTPEMVKLWADNSGAETGAVRAAVQAIDCCASYRPRRASPHYEWWAGHLEE